MLRNGSLQPPGRYCLLNNSGDSALARLDWLSHCCISRCILCLQVFIPVRGTFFSKPTNSFPISTCTTTDIPQTLVYAITHISILSFPVQFTHNLPCISPSPSHTNPMLFRVESKAYQGSQGPLDRAAEYPTGLISCLPSNHSTLLIHW